MNTDDLIYDAVARMIEEPGDKAEVTVTARLVDDLGLKSLDIARLLAILELELECDPFGSGQIPVTGIQTVGDLYAAYAR